MYVNIYLIIVLLSMMLLYSFIDLFLSYCFSSMVIKLSLLFHFQLSNTACLICCVFIWFILPMNILIMFQFYFQMNFLKSLLFQLIIICSSLIIYSFILYIFIFNCSNKLSIHYFIVTISMVVFIITFNISFSIQ